MNGGNKTFLKKCEIRKVKWLSQDHAKSSGTCLFTMYFNTVSQTRTWEMPTTFQKLLFKLKPLMRFLNVCYLGFYVLKLFISRMMKAKEKICTCMSQVNHFRSLGFVINYLQAHLFALWIIYASSSKSLKYIYLIETQ